MHCTNTHDKVIFLTRCMGPQDRCSVDAFNDKYHQLVLLESENMAKAALLWTLDKCQNATTLWDAICAACLKHIQSADGSRPWVLVVLTDGADSGSRIANKSQAIELLKAFNKPANNFSFVIGLGRDADTPGLQSLCSSSGSMYIPAEDSSTLTMIFALIALQVSCLFDRLEIQLSFWQVRQGVRINLAQIQNGNEEAMFAQVQRTAQISQKAIDILLLVDISGSMNDK